MCACTVGRGWGEPGEFGSVDPAMLTRPITAAQASVAIAPNAAMTVPRTEGSDGSEARLAVVTGRASSRGADAVNHAVSRTKTVSRKVRSGVAVHEASTEAHFFPSGLSGRADLIPAFAVALTAARQPTTRRAASTARAAVRPEGGHRDPVPTIDAPAASRACSSRDRAGRCRGNGSGNHLHDHRPGLARARQD
jgi:hypothetical protein